MSSDLYTIETQDFDVIQGDTANLPFQFRNMNNVNIDITSYDSVFTIMDHRTFDPISTLEKTHDDAISGGDGIYYYGDTEAWSALGLSATNQLVVVLTAAETLTLEPGIYKFNVKLATTVNGTNVRKTVIEGNLMVKQEAPE